MWLALLLACSTEAPEVPVVWEADGVSAPAPGELSLAVDPLSPGVDVVAEVTGAAPGERVALVRGRSAGAGPCPPLLGGLCVGVTPATLHATAVADGDGVVRFLLPVPADVPLGTPVAFQAFVPRGPDTASSDPVERVVAAPRIGPRTGLLASDTPDLDGTDGAVLAMPDGGVLVAYPVDRLDGVDLRLERFDADGSVRWAFDFGSADEDDFVEGLVPGPDGSVYLGHDVDEAYPVDARRMMVTRIDADGAVLWSEGVTETHDGLGIDVGTELAGIAPTADGGVALVGMAHTLNSFHELLDSDPIAVGFDPDGGLVWTAELEAWFDWDPDPTALGGAPDGRLLFAAGNKLVELASDGTLVRSVDLDVPHADVWQVSSTHDGGWLLSGAWSGASRGFVAWLEADLSVRWLTYVGEHDERTDIRGGVVLVPAACPTDVVPDAACVDDGRVCSTAAERCTCDGVWSCAPGEPRVHAGFGVDSGLPGFNLVFTPDGAVVDARQTTDWPEPLGASAAWDGGVAQFVPGRYRYSGYGVRFVDPEAGAGCDDPPIEPGYLYTPDIPVVEDLRSTRPLYLPIVEPVRRLTEWRDLEPVPLLAECVE